MKAVRLVLSLFGIFLSEYVPGLLAKRDVSEEKVVGFSEGRRTTNRRGPSSTSNDKKLKRRRRSTSSKRQPRRLSKSRQPDENFLGIIAQPFPGQRDRKKTGPQKQTARAKTKGPVPDFLLDDNAVLTSMKSHLREVLESERPFKDCPITAPGSKSHLQNAIKLAKNTGLPMNDEVMKEAEALVNQGRGSWKNALRKVRTHLKDEAFMKAELQRFSIEAAGRSKVDGGVAMVDAGSSGTKIFSYATDGTLTTVKVLTLCEGHMEVQGKPLKGVSAFGYDLASCRPRITIADKKNLGIIEKDKSLTQENEIDLYAPMVLDALNTIHGPSAVNKLEVPIFATAGMRLLSQESNDKVWNAICGKKSTTSDYAFAPRGKKCGTIPGTQEAYLEYLTNIAAGEKRENTGTFTIGGASAQIAIPLQTDEQMKAFGELANTIKLILKDCKNVTLLNGQPIPVFSSEGCYKDFVDMRSREEILEDVMPANHHSIGDSTKAVGLVSFLGLGHLSGGMGIAGGANSIEAWAAKRSCAMGMNWTSSGGYKGCKKKLLDALQEDQVWVAVSNFIARHKCPANSKKCSFTYNTPSAIPSMQFTNKDITHKGKKTRIKKEDMCEFEKAIFALKKAEEEDHSLLVADQLFNLLDRECEGEDVSFGFGFGNRKTCMKAFWLALYIKTFFPSDQHAPPALELFFEPLDWSLGQYHDMLRDAQDVKK